MAVVSGTSPLPRVCRVTHARAYPGWCRSARHGVTSRGDEKTSPVHLGAFGTVDQKDVAAFGTVDQKDAVAAGTVRKCWFCPGKETGSAVNHHSSVISPGPRVSDPVLEVGDGRCAGDIPPSPMCAASRPHEHTPGCAVPSGTVCDPELETRPPRYMVAEVGPSAPPLVPHNLHMGFPIASKSPN